MQQFLVRFGWQWRPISRTPPKIGSIPTSPANLAVSTNTILNTPRIPHQQLNHRLLADDEMWAHINNHPSYFRDLPPMQGAVEFFHSIHHLNPVILTACPKSNYPLAAIQKRQWVREHLSATCLVLPVLGGRHKSLFMHQPGDVLIDDFEANCDAWTAAGGVAIRHAGDWAVTRHALSQIEDLSGTARVAG